MGELNERVAYLKGLAEGLALDANSKEGKLFSAIISVLEDMTDSLNEITDYQEELEEYIEAIDEDLGDLEEEIYGDDDEAEEDDDYEDEDDEGDYVEMECPKCHDIVRFETSILADDDVIEVTCPNCNAVVYMNDKEEDK